MGGPSTTGPPRFRPRTHGLVARFRVVESREVVPVTLPVPAVPPVPVVLVLPAMPAVAPVASMGPAIPPVPAVPFGALMLL